MVSSDQLTHRVPAACKPAIGCAGTTLAEFIQEWIDRHSGVIGTVCDALLVATRLAEAPPSAWL